MAWPNDPRPARSLVVLGVECDKEWPGRDRASEGLIGDTRHQQESSSDHNPWKKDNSGKGVVRARDVDSGPGLNPNEAHDFIGDTVAEAALAGLLTYFGIRRFFTKRFPPMADGAYIIHERKIASHKTKGKWIPYHGIDPHTSHPHVSVALAQVNYDNQSSWRIAQFAGTARAVRSKPPVLTRANWKRHRLAVRRLQRELALGTVDGVYGKATARAVAHYKKSHKLGKSGWYVGRSMWNQLTK